MMLSGEMNRAGIRQADSFRYVCWSFISVGKYEGRLSHFEL